jgi:predicted RNA-binding protein with RPS1 domain
MLTPERTHPTENGVVFFGMPFGEKITGDGQKCDFNAIYSEAFAPTVQALGMKPERLDNLYGPQGVLDLIWRAIQRAEIVVIDFSHKNSNVTFEYGLAWTLGKRIITLTQHEDDIPSDVRGLDRYIRYSQHFADMERMKRELTLQLEALREEPPQERAPLPWNIGPSAVAAPASIVAVDQEYATVRTDDGRLGFLRSGDVEYTRLVTDLTRRFKIGDRLDGAFLVDPKRGEARYTLLAGKNNPWPVLASRYPAGTTFHGTVVNAAREVGVFVRVDGEVNGLIPQSTITGPVPAAGTRVEVTVTRIDSSKRRITLRLARIEAPAQQNDVYVGQRAHATVTHIEPERNGKGGYLLLRLPNRQRPALLHAQHMSEDLRADLSNGHIDPDEELYVEILSIDTARDKVVLRELPDPEEAAGLATAA